MPGHAPRRQDADQDGPDRRPAQHTIAPRDHRARLARRIPQALDKCDTIENVNHEHDLIDTIEMYLRTIFELEEEGAVPLRARIAERLMQSVPTVSQTVARMARDGLVTVEGDRRLELTPAGRAIATRVMRKHRLAECLLVDVIGLDWELVHEEACRWEHVISEAVERRLLDVLGHPHESPYGNPIPGLAELGDGADAEGFREGLVALNTVPANTQKVIVRRIGEPLQSDTALMMRLTRAGVRPNLPVSIARVGGRLMVGPQSGAEELDDLDASHVFVSIAG
jgi:DtxR family transcriptional regulator, Mn-dependent transcriptional regulator